MPLPASSISRAKAKHPGAVAAAIALWLTAGGAPAEPGRGGCAVPRQIASEVALQRALRCAGPAARLVLAPGTVIGELVIRNRRAGGLAIVSADPARPARFSGISITDSSGITLQSLLLAAPVPAGWRHALQVRRSRQITLVGLTLRGPGDSNPVDSGLIIRESDSVTARRLTLTGYRNGITMQNSSNVTLTENAVHRMLVDGIRGASVSGAVIERNLIGNFNPSPGSHADGIQFWSHNQSAASHNIVIRHNLIIRGAGKPIQGIFVRDSVGLPFREVQITGNAVIGGDYHGISVNGADGVTVSDNVVVPLAPQLSWIRIAAAQRALATGNQAGKFVLPDQAAGRGNVLVPLRREAGAELRSWLNRSQLTQANFPLAVLENEILRGE